MLNNGSRPWAQENGYRSTRCLLLARISGGDLVAIDGKYHYKCYKNRHKSHMREHRMIVEVRVMIDICWEEHLLSLFVTLKVVWWMAHYIFKLSQLHCLYESRLSNLGKEWCSTQGNPWCPCSHSRHWCHSKLLLVGAFFRLNVMYPGANNYYIGGFGYWQALSALHQ